jgi:hypothetical protein
VLVLENRRDCFVLPQIELLRLTFTLLHFIVGLYHEHEYDTACHGPLTM